MLFSSWYIFGVLIVLILVVLLWLIANRLRKRQFVDMEIQRHLERIQLSLHRLTSEKNQKWAYCSSALSQTDLMAIVAKHLLTGKQRELFGALFGMALNIPVRHAKRAVFTEKPRSIGNLMSPRPATSLILKRRSILPAVRRPPSNGIAVRDG